MDTFYLYDTNGLVRAVFNSNKSEQTNLSELEYECSEGRISSATYEYAKKRIKSWYKHKIKTKENENHKSDIIPLYMRIPF